MSKHEKIDNPFDSTHRQQQNRLKFEMWTEASAAVLQIEGIQSEVEPTDFGKLETQDDGTTLFIWRGTPVLRFGFKPSPKVGRGLELIVDRLHLEQKPRDE
jgi:hypothetical protein